MAIVEKSKSNHFQCRCKFCPTFSLGCLAKAAPKVAKIFVIPDGPKKEDHVENMFCAYGRSDCIKQKQGCKCPTCPVHKKYDLDKVYYCFGGE
ncbi:MAG TPA: hypothetical protein DIT25_03605 [Candidatus Moranbacteria bacterium]|nr:hypothetical protein [Candidatus Moranbacteria bacterium]